MAGDDLVYTPMVRKASETRPATLASAGYSIWVPKILPSRQVWFPARTVRFPAREDSLPARDFAVSSARDVLFSSRDVSFPGRGILFHSRNGLTMIGPRVAPKAKLRRTRYGHCRVLK